jgi:hypothetical protein
VGYAGEFAATFSEEPPLESLCLCGTDDIRGKTNASILRALPPPKTLHIYGFLPSDSYFALKSFEGLAALHLEKNPVNPEFIRDFTSGFGNLRELGLRLDWCSLARFGSLPEAISLELSMDLRGVDFPASPDGLLHVASACPRLRQLTLSLRSRHGFNKFSLEGEDSSSFRSRLVELSAALPNL